MIATEVRNLGKRINSLIPSTYIYVLEVSGGSTLSLQGAHDSKITFIVRPLHKFRQENQFFNS